MEETEYTRAKRIADSAEAELDRLPYGTNTSKSAAMALVSIAVSLAELLRIYRAR